MNDFLKKPRAPGQRLSRAERQRIVETIAHEMVERGETRLFVLAELVNISRRRIAPLVELARLHIARETNETPEAARTKLTGRFDKLYRESLSVFEECVKKRDFKNANAALANANAIVANESKVRGIESLPTSGNAGFRFTLEATGIPPAILERLARIHAQSGPGAVLELHGEVPGDGDGRAVREDDSAPVRALANGGDAAGDP